MSTREDRDNAAAFLLVIAAEPSNYFKGDSMTINWCRDIMTRARRARRYAILDCNGELTKRQGCANGSNNYNIIVLAKRAGFGVTTGGDPRGYVVHLMLKSKRYNTMGGAEHGYGIPGPL